MNILLLIAVDLPPPLLGPAIQRRQPVGLVRSQLPVRTGLPDVGRQADVLVSTGARCSGNET